MAERADNLSPSHRGPVPKYPWDRWSDGSAWTIIRGEDYDVPTASMARAIYSHAERYGRTVEIRTLRDRDGISFQFGNGATVDDEPLAVAS